MKPPAISEEALHRAVAEYLDVVIQPPAFWSTFPAGGGGRVRGAKLKAMGLKPGMPDLMIFAPGGKVLGIELKKRDGYYTREQRDMSRRFADCGMWMVLCRSVEEVARAVHFVTKREAA